MGGPLLPQTQHDDDGSWPETPVAGDYRAHYLTRASVQYDPLVTWRLHLANGSAALIPSLADLPLPWWVTTPLTQAPLLPPVRICIHNIPRPRPVTGFAITLPLGSERTVLSAPIYLGEMHAVDPSAPVQLFNRSGAMIDQAADARLPGLARLLRPGVQAAI